MQHGHVKLWCISTRVKSFFVQKHPHDLHIETKPQTDFTNDFRVHNQNLHDLVKIFVAFTLFLTIQSGHNLAHATTAESCRGMCKIVTWSNHDFSYITALHVYHEISMMSAWIFCDTGHRAHVWGWQSCKFAISNSLAGRLPSAGHATAQLMKLRLAGTIACYSTLLQY